MRTLEDFEVKFQLHRQFVQFHNKAAWFVPTESSYVTSIIEPEFWELPKGTCAILYSPSMEAIASIYSGE